jgi:hypothetical protein
MDKELAAHDLCAAYLVRAAESVDGLCHLKGHVASRDFRAAGEAAVPAGLSAFAGYPDRRLDPCATVASIPARASITVAVLLSPAIRVNTDFATGR